MTRSVSAEGRSRATVGGRSVPVSLLTYLADDLVAVHGQADQQQLLRPGRQRAGARPVRRPELAELLAGYQRAYHRHQQVRGRAGGADHAARRARPARPRTCAAAWPRSSAPSRPRARTSSWSPRRSGSRNADALHAAATTRARGAARRPGQRQLRQRRRDQPARQPPGPRSTLPRSTTRSSRRWPARGRRGGLPAVATSPPSSPPTRSRSRPTRPGWRPCRIAGPS